MNSPGVPRSANCRPEPDSSGSFSEVKLANYDTTHYAPALGANGIGLR